MTSEASTPTTTNRRNVAGSIERTDRFKNIEDGLIPFKNNTIGYDGSKSSVDIREAVVLCQKCYWNFALFRNIIDLMTEFSVTNIYFKGGSKNSQDFFNAWWNKINGWDLMDKVIREYYRSGNVFIYRYDAMIKPEDVMRITQVFGSSNPISAIPTEPYSIPARYIVLNPADIQIMGTANFSAGLYFKILTDYEISRLKSPQNDEDQAVLDSLPADIRKAIKAGARSVIVPLELDKTSMIFYKKQDYEPFAVPMGYAVLEDINAKYEMKKIDMAIARTMQQIVLLVTTGTKPEEGGINKENLAALQKLFQNQSVGRVLIADYTTKAEFVVPAIGELLTPEKYLVLDRDINIGLNNIFAGDEKFANQAQKVEIFVARLEQGRKAFLNNFLIPEIKRVSKALGFKNYPTPYFEDIELKDNSNQAKIYARLMELGILTPAQGLKAIETNTLPEPEVMEEAQKEFKAQRDKGLYEPLVGGPKEAEEGRPEGATGPKLTNKVGPIGSKASVDQIKYSVIKVRDNMLVFQELQGKIETYLKKKHKVKKLTDTQKECVDAIAHIVIANEESKDWLQKYSQYCDKPQDTNLERVEKIYDIAVAHEVDHYLASILYASKV